MCAEADLQRAGLTRVSTPGYPIFYFAYSASLPPTPQRESWQEVLADVNRAQPIPFKLES